MSGLFLSIKGVRLLPNFFKREFKLPDPIGRQLKGASIFSASLRPPIPAGRVASSPPGRNLKEEKWLVRKWKEIK
jgi:hypothetical protein